MKRCVNRRELLRTLAASVTLAHPAVGFGQPATLRRPRRRSASRFPQALLLQADEVMQ